MTRKNFKVLFTDTSVDPAGIDLLRPVAELSFLESYASTEALVAAIGEADAIFCRSGIIDEPVIAAAPKLKIVSRHGVGYDNIDIAACTRRGIVVTIGGEANSQSVSEHAFGLILATARDLLRANADMDAGRWERTTLVGTELHRKVLGIVGLGRVGSRLARHATGFDMEVLACDPYLDANTAAERGAQLVDLTTLLRQSDFVSLHLPLSQETRNLIGTAEIALMKQSAILVNTARGGIIDEEALHNALKDNRIAGAALDVFAEEPLPPDHPLTGLDNLCHSPHIAGQTAESLVRMSLQAAQNILTIFHGEALAPDFVVNPEALV